MSHTRRKFLYGTLVSGLVLAGCVGEEGSGNATASPTEAGTRAGTPTHTEARTGTSTRTELPTETQMRTETQTETPTPTDTQTPSASTAQMEYPDYEWSKLAGVEPEPTDTIRMTGFEFEPLVAAVEPDTPVTVTNEDPGGHTMTVPVLDIDITLDAGASTPITADRTGTFDYVCRFHPPGMLGRLVVTSDP